MLACKALSFFMVFSHTYVVTAGSYPLPSWFPLSLTTAFLPASCIPLPRYPKLSWSPFYIYGSYSHSHLDFTYERKYVALFVFLNLEAPTLQRIIKFSFDTVEHMLVA